MVVANPYLTPIARVVAAPPPRQHGRQHEGSQSTTMGPQSQRRISLLDRTHQLQSQSHNNNNNKRKKGAQQTLFGTVAFDPSKNCPKCRGGKASHKGHHPNCWNNPRKKGQSATLQEEKRLKMLLEAPLTEEEKCSGQHLTKEATTAFFAPREGVAKVAAAGTATTTILPNTTQSTMIINSVTADDICSCVTKIVNDSAFVESNKASTAPLAMLALAKVVSENIINDRQIDTRAHFDGLTYTVPSTNKYMEPHYHSIVGQKLLHVDWIRMYNLQQLQCLRCVKGILKNDRTNFSKNKNLFPIFVLEGPPIWCMVQSMICSCCKWRVNANNGELLCSLPAYARQAYPVETKYAVNKNSHIGRSATDVMDLLMPTYANGDFCSRLLFNAINRSYIERIENYFSSYKLYRKEGEPIAYIAKDGAYIRNYPPLGE